MSRVHGLGRRVRSSVRGLSSREVGIAWAGSVETVTLSSGFC